jgi:hypothetical protein
MRKDAVNSMTLQAQSQRQQMRSAREAACFANDCAPLQRVMAIKFGQRCEIGHDSKRMAELSPIRQIARKVSRQSVTYFVSTAGGDGSEAWSLRSFFSSFLAFFLLSLCRFSN